MNEPVTLTTQQLSLGYAGRTIVDKVSTELPAGKITAIIGPNGCGKSTLLRGLARLLEPLGGVVHLDGHDITTIASRQLATKIGLLPQQPIAPDGITVADLIGRGRHPHQRWFRQWSSADDAAVTGAMSATGITDLADAPIDELSGGQRQRVWIALALAQDPDVMLLDEPTTYLDLAHQLDVLGLLATINREHRRTIVLVVHDLNMAARFAHHLIAMRDGKLIAQGTPQDVVTAGMVRDVFGVEATIIADPVTTSPLILPHARAGSSGKLAT
ncbi:MAG: ABC transporter ATP-binding protein [Mycobacterium sp.]